MNIQHQMFRFPFMTQGVAVAAGAALVLLSSPGQGATYSTEIRDYNSLGLPGTVVSLKDGAEVSQQHYDWTADGLLQTFTNPRGTRSFQYADRRLTAFSNSAGIDIHVNGRDATFGYPTSVTTTTGSNGVSVDAGIEYDAMGNVAHISTPGVPSRRVTLYDRMGKPLVVLHNADTSQAYQNRYSYYPNGMVKSLTMNEGGQLHETLSTTVGVTNTGFGGYRVSSQTVTGSGHTLSTTYDYDVLGRVTRTVRSDGDLTRETHYSYQLNVTEPTLRHCVSGGCTLVNARLPNGADTSVMYDAMGNLVREVGARGETTSYEYDGLNRLVLTVAGQGTLSADEPTVDVALSPPVFLRTEYEYDDEGHVSRSLTYYDANGSNGYDGGDGVIEEQTWEYNAAGQRVKETVGAPGSRLQRRYYYDAESRPVRVTESGPDLVRVAEATYQNGTLHTVRINGIRGDLVSTRDFNAQGFVSQADSPRSGDDAVTYTYTELGQVESIRFNDSNTGQQVIQYEYDVPGRVIRIDMPGVGATGDIVRTYDAFGRLLSAAVGSATESRTYHGDGRLKTYTDYSGRTTQYHYDAPGHLTLVDAPGVAADVGYSGFDSNGQPGTITRFHAGVQHLRVYTDGLGRVVKQVHPGHTIITTYPTYRHQVSSVLSVPGQADVTFHRIYNTAGQLIQSAQWVGDSKKQDALFRHDVFGVTQVTRPMPDGVNNVISRYYYRDTGVLDTINHGQGGGWSLGYLVGRDGGQPYSVHETRQLAGSYSEHNMNPVSRDNQGRVTRYEQSMNGDSRSYVFDYNVRGNPTDMPYVGALGYDARGWLFSGGTSGGGQSGSDSQGNVTGPLSPLLPGNLAVVYDELDRVVQAGGVTYQYGPDGSLAQSCDPAGCTLFYQDITTGQTLGTVQPGVGYKVYNHGALGDILGEHQVATDTTRLFLNNTQGSVVAALNGQGDWLGSRRYHAYGMLQEDSIADMPFGFLGQPHFSNGFIQMGAATYNPLIGMMLNASAGQQAFAGGQPFAANLPDAPFISPFPMTPGGGSTPNGLFGAAHLALGVASLAADSVGIGLAAAVFDAADVGVSLLEGDRVGAGIGLAALTVPGVAAGFSKLGSDGVQASRTVRHAQRALPPAKPVAGLLPPFGESSFWTDYRNDVLHSGSGDIVKVGDFYPAIGNTNNTLAYGFPMKNGVVEPSRGTFKVHSRRLAARMSRINPFSIQESGFTSFYTNATSLSRRNTQLTGHGVESGAQFIVPKDTVIEFYTQSGTRLNSQIGTSIELLQDPLQLNIIGTHGQVVEPVSRGFFGTHYYMPGDVVNDVIIFPPEDLIIATGSLMVDGPRTLSGIINELGPGRVYCVNTCRAIR